MGLVRKYFRNMKKPVGFLGKMALFGMNAGHASISDWGMKHIAALTPREVADFGCGGGRNTAALLDLYPQAHVTALDYSDVSVAYTQKHNRHAIEQGRCRVLPGTVSSLPFADNSFDVITAFETVYFWPGPSDSFREIRRVLKPGGTFLIANASDGNSKNDEKWLERVDGLRLYTQNQLVSLLKDVGFTEILPDHDEHAHRLCILSKK